jgi:hypothetical protein
MTTNINDFQRNSDGSIAATLGNVTKALAISTQTGMSFAVDGRRNRLLFDHEKGDTIWRDPLPVDSVRLRHGLETRDGFQPVSRELLEDALLLICSKRVIDPFLEVAKEAGKKK